MQIRINLKIFIMILFFLLTRKLELYLMLMLFAIIHEFGHLIVGRLLGFKPKNVEIMPVGVCASFYMNCKNYNKKIRNGNVLALKKIVIASAGPITSFIVSLIFFMYGKSILGVENEILVYSNLVIGIFNLIPIYPLDGGRILKNLIHIYKGLKISYKYTNIISNMMIILFTVLSSFIILYLKNFAILIILGYLWMIVIIQNKRYNEKMKIYNLIEK